MRDTDPLKIPVRAYRPVLAHGHLADVPQHELVEFHWGSDVREGFPGLIKG